MKVMPILDSGGTRTIPYALVKQHEEQVKINHSGQTVDRICERGGLSWVELYCVLHDHKYVENISQEIAIDSVSRMIDEFIEKYGRICGNPEVKVVTISNEKPKNKHPLNLRPCEVRLDPDKITVNAHFHRWCDFSVIVEPSLLVGGGQGGVNRHIVGIIEYEDGTIDEVSPKNIKFTDRGW